MNSLVPETETVVSSRCWIVENMVCRKVVKAVLSKFRAMTPGEILTGWLAMEWDPEDILNFW